MPSPSTDWGVLVLELICFSNFISRILNSQFSTCSWMESSFFNIPELQCSFIFWQLNNCPNQKQISWGQVFVYQSHKCLKIYYLILLATIERNSKVKYAYILNWEDTDPPTRSTNTSSIYEYKYSAWSPF